MRSCGCATGPVEQPRTRGLDSGRDRRPGRRGRACLRPAFGRTTRFRLTAAGSVGREASGVPGRRRTVVHVRADRSPGDHGADRRRGTSASPAVGADRPGRRLPRRPVRRRAAAGASMPPDRPPTRAGACEPAVAGAVHGVVPGECRAGPELRGRRGRDPDGHVPDRHRPGGGGVRDVGGAAVHRAVLRDRALRRPAPEWTRRYPRRHSGVPAGERVRRPGTGDRHPDRSGDGWALAAAGVRVPGV